MSLLKLYRKRIKRARLIQNICLGIIGLSFFLTLGFVGYVETNENVSLLPVFLRCLGTLSVAGLFVFILNYYETVIETYKEKYNKMLIIIKDSREREEVLSKLYIQSIRGGE